MIPPFSKTSSFDVFWCSPSQILGDFFNSRASTVEESVWRCPEVMSVRRKPSSCSRWCWIWVSKADWEELGGQGTGRETSGLLYIVCWHFQHLTTSFNIFQLLARVHQQDAAHRLCVRRLARKLARHILSSPNCRLYPYLVLQQGFPPPAQHLLSCPTTGFQATPYLRLETSSFDEMQHDDMDVHIVFNFYYLTLFYRNWPRIQPPFRSLSSPTPGLKSLATGLAMATGRLFAKFHWLTLAPISTLFPIPFLFHWFCPAPIRTFPTFPEQSLR